MSENDIQDDVVEQEKPTSEETKFFGIKTQIMPRAGDDVPGEEEYKIEVAFYCNILSM